MSSSTLRRSTSPSTDTDRPGACDVAWYPVESGWVLPARFDPAGDGETVPIVTMQGDVVDTPAAGRLHVRLHGAVPALLATWAGGELFVNPRDAGSGSESYGAGRFLTVDPPVDGAATVDFHRLPFVVRAGERTP